MNSFLKDLQKAKDMIDQVRDIAEEVAPSTSEPTSENVSQSSDHDSDMPKLISPADVAKATNLPFDTQNPYEDENWTGITITCSDPKVGSYYELRMAKMGEEGYESGDQAWGYVREVAEDQEDISDLGDEAFRTGEAIYFRQGKYVFNSFANLPKPALPIVKKLARLAISRL